MCGIAGIVNFDPARTVDAKRISRMRDALHHRGPDDNGIFLRGNAGLASTRLAIIDLSTQGHMPMSSDDGRFHIVYNGELYNYRCLRRFLEQRGHRFVSKTDTEVVLRLFIHEGPAMLTRCNGMFAFAIWDEREQMLFASRDRLGVKPLYYVIHERALFFGSEPKALFAGGITPEFDESTWNELLCFRHVAGERTVYRGVRRLLPGHFLRLHEGHIQFQRWWSLSDAANAQGSDLDAAEAGKNLRELFEDSVALRRISDVPVGTLLSGGLDSGVLTGVMAAQAGRNVTSFTVRFADSKYDEGDAAATVTKMWSLDHHEMFVPPSQISSLLEEATLFADAPIMHENSLHILAISRYAKPFVTVLLSGEGADETMGGYVRYRLFRLDRLFPLLRTMLPLVPSFLDSTRRINKSVRLLQTPGPDLSVLLSSSEANPVHTSRESLEEMFGYRMTLVGEAQRVYKDPVRQVLYYDQHTYLQSLLDRNDRMTMGASIECREPYLDYRIVEFLAGLPTKMFFEQGVGKALFRRAMVDYVPKSILKGRKWGFGVPIVKYLRETPELRSYVESLPSSQFIQSRPFSKQQVAEAVQSFIQGDDSQNTFVRQLVMTSVWYDKCICGKSLFAQDAGKFANAEEILT